VRRQKEREQASNTSNMSRQGLTQAISRSGRGRVRATAAAVTGVFAMTEPFEEAVDLVGAQALSRALAPSDGQERVIRWEPTFVLMAMTPQYALTRLRMVLDLGSSYGVAALLLGYWRSGSAVLVWPGGQVCAPGPGLGRAMHEVWLGDMDAARAVEQLIRIAQRERGPSRPSGSPAWQARDGSTTNPSTTYCQAARRRWLAADPLR
jgi:hypothetical protein